MCAVLNCGATALVVTYRMFLKYASVLCTKQDNKDSSFLWKGEYEATETAIPAFQGHLHQTLPSHVETLFLDKKRDTSNIFFLMYKVVQIWPGLIVCKQVTVCPGHIWTTLYFITSLHRRCDIAKFS
jgi:hypothetical protein